MQLSRISLTLILLVFAACDGHNDDPASSVPLPIPVIESKPVATPVANDYELNEGDFPPIPGATLGAATRFLSEIDDIVCYQLSINGRDMGWIHHAEKTPSNIIFHKCVVFEGAPFARDSIYGGEELKALYALRDTDNGKAVYKLPIEDYNALSSSYSSCGNMLAYWGTEGIKHYGAIFDLNRGITLKKELVAEFNMGGDTFENLPIPMWKGDCGEVRFYVQQGINAEKTLVP